MIDVDKMFVMWWCQLLSEMDDLIEWFGETERQIAEAEPVICDAEKLRELSRDHKVMFYTWQLFLTWLLECVAAQDQALTHNYPK